MEKQDNLKGLREIELEIADVIEAVCRKNGLRCSLTFGSLLGAVRHGGFIPWDDDMDLMMPREDYEKLLEIWDAEAPPGYILQNKRTNWDFTQNFTKIRKDHTAFIQGEAEKSASYHTGIFVDIFPMDRAAPGRLARLWQVFLCALNLLYARGFTSGSGGIQNLFERFLLCLPVRFRKWAYFRSERAIGKRNGDSANRWFMADTMKDVHVLFSSGLFDSFKETAFEDRSYRCVANTDDYLRMQYGDYMTLPPEEERVSNHNRAFISLDRNYAETERPE